MHTATFIYEMAVEEMRHTHARTHTLRLCYIREFKGSQEEKMWVFWCIEPKQLTVPYNELWGEYGSGQSDEQS